jgi:chromosome segregation ATPase
MNEKKPLFLALLAMLIVCLACLFVCSLAGCQSNSRVDDTILEYQRQIAILEARNSLYEQTVRDCYIEIADVRTRAESVEGTVDELIAEFACYQRAVERMLLYYTDSEAEIENTLNSSNNADDNTNR